MATLVYTHTEQTSWTRAMATQAALFDLTTPALSGPGGYAWAETLWSSGPSPVSGVGRIVTPALAESSTIAWRFYGTNAADKTGTARIWGVSEIVSGATTEYVGESLCELSLTTGATQIQSTVDNDPGSVVLPTSYQVDTIIIDEDRSHMPGARVVSGGDDGIAVLLLDAMGYKYFILEMLNDTTGGTTGLGALYRVF